MNFDEIVVKESPGLCRCCLSEGCYKDLGSEYTWMNETEVYAEMLLDCFDIGITQHSDGPNGAKRLICEVCITRLRDACNFKKQVLDSEKRFIDMLGRGEFRPKVLIYQQQDQDLKEESEEPTDMDLAEDVEYLEDLDYGGDEEVIKSEDVQSTSLPTTSEDADRPKLKRGRPKKEEDKSEKGKAKKAKAAKDCNPKWIVLPKHGKRRNLEILFNNTTVVPFKHRGTFLCFFCGVKIKDRGHLVDHNITHIPCRVDHPSIKSAKGKTEIKVDVSELQCKLCSQHFDNFNDIGFHLYEKHNLPYDSHATLLIAYRLIDFKCLICSKRMTNFHNLVRHKNCEHPENCIECDDCSQKFDKKKSLLTHIRQQHKKEHRCSKCPKIFKSYADLTRHKTRDHISQCNLCFKTFSSLLFRLDHMKAEHDIIKGGTCGFCRKLFKTKNGFLDHATKCVVRDPNYPESLEIVIEDEKTNFDVRMTRNKIAFIINNTTALPFKYCHNRFRCFYCTKEFIKIYDLRYHTSIEHPICDVNLKCMKLKNLCASKGMKIKIDSSILKCKLCEEQSDSFEAIVTHLDTEHKAKLGDCFDKFVAYKLVDDKFPCPRCDKEFRHFGVLLKHVNEKHTACRTICVYCGKPFHNETALRSHIVRTHKTKNGFQCTECELGFRLKSELNHHMGSVHKKKVFKCPSCTELFVSQHAKLVHAIKVHNGGHKCTHCDGKFTKYSAMTAHVRRVHLNEKNVQCSFCDKTFFDQIRLRNHMVIHNGDRSFSCDYCHKSFLRKKNLVEHISLHLNRHLN